MEKLIKAILTSDNLDEQVAMIAQLNKHMFDAEALTALATYLRSECLAVKGIPADAVDVVGTGGDGLDTLNFSTLSAIVAARAGVKIAKHGNKSATSRCGSFDLLMRMGVPSVEMGSSGLASIGATSWSGISLSMNAPMREHPTTHALYLYISRLL